jgi:hypothetical protein
MKLVSSGHERCSLTPSPALRGGGACPGLDPGWGGGATRGLPTCLPKPLAKADAAFPHPNPPEKVGEKTLWNQREQEAHFLSGVVRAAARWWSPPQERERERSVASVDMIRTSETLHQLVMPGLERDARLRADVPGIHAPNGAAAKKNARRQQHQSGFTKSLAMIASASKPLSTKPCCCSQSIWLATFLTSSLPSRSI